MLTIRMNLRTVLSVGTAAVLCIGAGCKKDEAKSEDNASTPASPKVAETLAAPIEAAKVDTTAEPAKPPTPKVAISSGLAEAGNNPKLIDLVAAFESCKLTSKNIAWDCREAIKSFNAAVDTSSDAETLFNFLDDSKPHVRIAAASAIASTMLMQQKEGRNFGDRLVAATARETETGLAKFLGYAILQGDFNKADYSAAVQTLVSTHPNEEIRAAIVANLPVQKWEIFFPFLKQRLATDKSPLVREAIMSSFYTSAGKEGACDFFAANMRDADAKVAAKAAYNVVWTSDACADKYDDFVAQFEERVAASKVDFMYLTATNYFAQAKKTTDEQKAKYFGLLKKTVEDTKIGGMGRASALANIGKYAADGKAYAKKFTGDAERFVADAAKKIVKGK